MRMCSYIICDSFRVYEVGRAIYCLCIFILVYSNGATLQVFTAQPKPNTSLLLTLTCVIHSAFFLHVLHPHSLLFLANLLAILWPMIGCNLLKQHDRNTTIKSQYNINKYSTIYQKQFEISVHCKFNLYTFSISKSCVQVCTVIASCFK